ncbi:multifunctional CCA addition/repair protein [Sedimenticola hydrogenitrophicus]|uniref:multifunctional CCA addition/repair protein n=1 Tax=Sedimenticola hydrogenitrophicus TaxID=2967975 RepID=UPI0021A4AAEB|nr:multifunctional CCA addition/repair protein [Sedimenticola hydrogenitrophicus]
MHTYLVGGAVRDQLLGVPIGDRDWLVTGVTAEQLLARGYRKVGRDFPVFLHPKSAEEYALPRGGADDGSEQAQVCNDLIQRDLTINAIALAADGSYIDPLDGRRDLRERRLRHTPTFRNDPIRVLRLARFAARLGPLGFRVAQPTRQLVRQMVQAGELDNLVPERVWSEIVRALQGTDPVTFFETLRELGALRVILPELDRLFGVPQPERHHPEIDTGVHSLMVLRQACNLSREPEIRLAALLHDLGKGTTPRADWPSHHGHEQRSARLAERVCERLRAPNRYRELCRLVAEYHSHCHRAFELKPATLLRTLQQLDALRRATRLDQFLLACEADSRGRQGFERRPYPQAEFFRAARQAAAAVDTRRLAKGADDQKMIPDIIFQARSRAIAAVKKRWEEQEILTIT